MKHSSSLFLGLLMILAGAAQTTDSSNYYEKYKGEGTTNWLRASDAVPIMIDELMKAGIAYHTIEVGTLYKINDSTWIVATVTFEKGGKEFGFVWESGHSIPLRKKDRDYLRSPNTQPYLQTGRDLAGNADFMGTPALPRNLYLVKETCYFYEQNGDGLVVTKAVIERILRQDIRSMLAMMN